MAVFHFPAENLSHVHLPRGSNLCSPQISANHLKPRGSHFVVFKSSSLLSRSESLLTGKLKKNITCCKKTENSYSFPSFFSHFSPESLPMGEIKATTKLGYGNWRNCSQFSRNLGFIYDNLKCNSLKIPKKIHKNICTDSKFAESEPESEERGEEFVKRLEQSWVIRKQPVPMACEKCCAQGSTECPWCRGTGFFILGDNMLCEVPSRNTTCLICQGNGSIQCVDCKGTGFRARWMGKPPTTEPQGGEHSKL